MESDPNLSRRNGGSYPPNEDEEVQDALGTNLSQKSRGGFVKKVYGILGTQILATALWLVAVSRSPSVNRFVRNHEGLSIFSGIVALAGILGLGMSDRLARSVPLNYAILGITTLAQAFATSLTVSYVPANIVAQAGLATAGAVGGITYLGLTRRTQNWNTAKTIMQLGFGVIVVQLLSFIFLRPSSQSMLISSLFGIISGLTLLYQTEQVLGNKDRKYSKDDYIRASMNIYLEILQLFIELLRFLNKLQNPDQKEDTKKKEGESKK